MAAHVTLFGRVGRKGVGARQVGHFETVAAVAAVPDLGADRHAAVIADVFVTARNGVEKRGLAAVGVAHQCHADRAAVTVDDFVDRRAAVIRTGRLGRRVFRFRGLSVGAASAVPAVVFVVVMARAAPGEVFAGFAV